MPYITNIFFLYFFLPVIAFSTSIKDFSATYKLYHNDMYVGESFRQLNTSGENLSYTATTESDGLIAIFFDISITEKSKLNLKNKQLNFISYSYDEKNNDKKESYQLVLNKNQQFYNTHTKEYYPAAKNLQDILGFTVAIMHDLQAGKRTMNYTIAERDRFKTYTLKFLKEEKFTANNSQINTLKMEYFDPKENFRFTFWCAENMGFLPIKIQNINHKGDKKVFNLTHFNKKPLYLDLDNND